MQVKKFEAKSMQEALQLVKQELGPEAIILSAKDNKRSFGLGGNRSVEVTAAISEKSMVKRQAAESRLPETSRDKFRAAPAKRQREFIESTLKRQQRRSGGAAEAPASRTSSYGGTGAVAGPRRTVPTPTLTRYIDIQDEPDLEALGGRRVDDLLAEIKKPKGLDLKEASDDAEGGLSFKSQRATAAAQAAAEAAARFESVNQPASASRTARGFDEVTSLRKEVETLRGLLGQFQQGTVSGRPMTHHPGAEYGLPFELSSNFERLQNAGVDAKYIVEILTKADKELGPMEKKKKSLVDAWVARFMLTNTHVQGAWEKFDNPARIHHFVGPSGHGKTTALVKIAAHMVLHERKQIAIFTADTLKVGAADQLKIFAQILNVPFEIIRRTEDVPTLVHRYANTHIILIDYPGFSLRGMPEYDQLRALMPPVHGSKQTHLVMSCTSKDLDAYELCSRYQMSRFDDIIATKIDESSNHGILYNLQRRTEKPLYAFGIGSKVPEDIELATRERVIDLIFKITKNGFSRGNL